MNIPDQTAIRILKTIAQRQLAPVAATTYPPDSFTPVALREAFPTLIPIPASEGDLARAALDLLSEDPRFADPIRIMAAQPESSPGAERYLEPTTIALTTAVLLALQTRVKFKASEGGKWSIELDKKSTADSTLNSLVQRLLSYLPKP